MNKTTVFEALEERRRQGIPCALIILVDSQGSVPAKKGAKMLVAEDGQTIGTVGGGAMESEAAEMGRRMMAEGEPRLIHLELTEAAGYACGGRVSLYIEPVLPAPRVIVCGAGHVGQAVCHLAAYTGFSVTVIDDREDFLNPEMLPDADQMRACAFDQAFSDISVDGDTLIVVCTRGHAHDLTIVKAALETDAAYIGLLGSRRKRASFFEKLRAAGFSDTDFERVYTPVGLDIGAVTPREIALSIVGELIAQRRVHGRRIGGHIAGRGCIQADGEDQAASPCAG
ncbi:MAG: XdhC family protein [Desulfobacterales bacterium]